MTQPTQSSALSWNAMGNAVFLTTHANEDLTAGFACFPVVVYRNDRLTSVIHRADPVASIGARIARLEANPARAAALSRARQRLGQWMAEEKLPQQGLSALRLKAGLSQKSLADRLGTQQSNVSRWERTPGDMQYSTIRSLATALKVSVDDVCQAIEASTAQEA